LTFLTKITLTAILYPLDTQVISISRNNHKSLVESYYYSKMYNLLALTLAMSSFAVAAPTLTSPAHSILPRDTSSRTVGDLDVTITDVTEFVEVTANHPDAVECGPVGAHYVNVDDVTVGGSVYWGFNSAILLFCSTMATGVNGNPFVLGPKKQANTIITTNDKAGDQNIHITSNGLEDAPEGQISCK
jgi:hypothetical protein